MSKSLKQRTVGEDLRSRGLDPRLVKFGRLVGRDLPNPLEMTVGQFERAAIGGRALDAADTLYIGLEQQLARLCAIPPNEPGLREILASMADAELALVLLLRLRRAAVLIRTHVEGGERLKDAIAAFDAAVPDVKHLRDTHEHFDDYILGKGRHKPGAGIGRSYSYAPGTAPVIARGQRNVDLGVALIQARQLYEQIYQVTTGHRPHLLPPDKSTKSHSEPPSRD